MTTRELQKIYSNKVKIAKVIYNFFFVDINF